MILAYHKVDLVAPTVWWVTAATFRRHLDDLRDRRFVHLADLDPGDPAHCVVTFDDAYENVWRHAFPILRARGLPFELFVNSDLIGGWNRFDPAEPLTRHAGLGALRAMAEEGGRIQWHTRSHPDLTAADPEALARELEPPDWLRRAFPPPHLSWFAYPYGAHAPAVVEAVRRRFEGAVSVQDGDPADRFLLPRVVPTAHSRFAPPAEDRPLPVADPARAARLERLWRRRFAALPRDCGRDAQPGVDEVPEWRDFHDKGTTADQRRIEDVLAAWGAAGRSILHVGVGNSGLARRFCPEGATVLGLTVSRPEKRHADALRLPNYRVVMLNKHAYEPAAGPATLDFIVDNNPTTFCCCWRHLVVMMDHYARMLRPGGALLTDWVGLGHVVSTAEANPRWGFSIDDLGAVADAFGLRTERVTDHVVALRRPEIDPRDLRRRLRRRLGRMFPALRRLARRGGGGPGGA